MVFSCKWRLFFLALFSLIFRSSFAQEDRAIIFFHDGDSIEGFAKIVKNEVKFKVSLSGKADIWDHYSISGVEISDGAYNNYYEYIEVAKSNDPKLLELAESGKCFLYTKTKKRGRTKGLNNIVKNDGTVTISTDELAKLNFKGEEAYEYYLKKKTELEAVCVNCGVIGVSDAWLKKTANFFSDCTALQEKILANEFSLDEMMDIVQFYNDFCDE